MKNAHSLDETGRNWQAQIDGETLRRLTWLCHRVVDTLGMIAPVLELAKNCKKEEKRRHLQTVVALAYRGHLALKAFSQQWALLLEESQKHLLPPYMEDFADILQKAEQITIADPPPRSVGETDAARALCEAARTDPAPISDSVKAEAPQALG